MSIVSSICADVDLGIVKKAVTRAKSQARSQMTTEEYVKVVKVLDDLQEYCAERMVE